MPKTLGDVSIEQQNRWLVKLRLAFRRCWWGAGAVRLAVGSRSTATDCGPASSAGRRRRARRKPPPSWCGAASALRRVLVDPLKLVAHREALQGVIRGVRRRPHALDARSRARPPRALGAVFRRAGYRPRLLAHLVRAPGQHGWPGLAGRALMCAQAWRCPPEP